MSDDYFNINNVNNYWAQQANARADMARSSEIDAKKNLEAQKFNNKSNIDLIIHLRNSAKSENDKAQQLVQNNVKLESEKQFFENLLSLPMKEIAEKNEKFKETYEAQQLILSKWILSQKAYAETALQIGVEAGKSTDEVKEIYTQNITSVLVNATKYGNNAVSNTTLKENLNKVIKSIKK